MGGSKVIVSTDKAPAAIGPYSQAVQTNGFVFCSGQIALKPGGDSLIGETAADQVEQVMANLKAVLEAAGSGLDKVVKTTIYLVDLNDFSAVNEAYGQYFPSQPPARATVEVSRLPRGARVEIDAIAAI
ncbi:MAG: RidA family protein [Candidatus Eremiobacteraeota bacterium]|nr:RidA family protein [Candidatus Eremiobacteraeota bacterium]